MILLVHVHVTSTCPCSTFSMSKAIQLLVSSARDPIEDVVVFVGSQQKRIVATCAYLHNDIEPTSNGAQNFNSISVQSVLAQVGNPSILDEERTKLCKTGMISLVPSKHTGTIGQEFTCSSVPFTVAGAQPLLAP